MKQFPIIIKTEHGNYPITLTCHSHSFSNIKEVDVMNLIKKQLEVYYEIK